MTTVEVVLAGPAAGGGFVARDPGGRVLFVRHGLPGERVIAEITEEHPRWARADAIEILEPSPDRINPACPAAGPGGCGGCDFQHVDLAVQRDLKAMLLEEQLRRVAKIDHTVVVEAVEGAGLGNRTRIRFGVDELGRLGMRRHGSHDIVAIDHCPLGVEAIGDLDLDEEVWPAGADVEVVAVTGSAPIAYAVLDEEEGADDGESIDELSPVGDDVILEEDDQVEDESGSGLLTTTVLGEEFTVSPGVFWQIHQRAPEVLTQAVLEGLDLREGDRVLDLYCGAGLFTLPIARLVGHSGRVIGIEAADVAAIDAIGNLGDLPQSRILNTTVTGASLRDHLAGASRCVLDPPRRGVDRSALLALAGSAVMERIVMVSCDPATFARDL
ncbi:MAG: TRAM domain-containing protein, partial [Actinomycetes bacterium]